MSSGVGEVCGAIFGAGYLLDHPATGDPKAFRARHARLSGTYVVQLLPLDAGVDPEAAAHVQAEARRASLLRHPGIAQVIDFNVSGEAPVFVVTEDVEGRSLKQFIAEEGILTPPRAIELVRQLADALQAAHALGVIHGDLHPDVVRLTEPADGKICTKLLGFGWAKELQADGGRGGESWIYLAPERQDGRPFDAQADQFSLAAIAYEMLSGCPPFADEATAEESPATGGEPADGADRAGRTLGSLKPPTPLTELVIGLRAEIDGVLQRALAHEPADRYPTVQDFTTALTTAAETEIERPAAVAAPTAAADNDQVGDGAATPAPIIAPSRPIAAKQADPAANPMPPPQRLPPTAQLVFLASALALVIGTVAIMAHALRRPPAPPVAAVAAASMPVELPPAAPLKPAIKPPPPAAELPSEEPSAKHRRSRSRSGRTHGSR